MATLGPMNGGGFNTHSEKLSMFGPRETPGEQAASAPSPPTLPPSVEAVRTPSAPPQPAFHPLKPLEADRSLFGSELFVDSRARRNAKFTAQQTQYLNDQARFELAEMDMFNYVQTADPYDAAHMIESWTSGFLARYCSEPEKVPTKTRTPKTPLTIDKIRAELRELRKRRRDEIAGRCECDPGLKKRLRWLLGVLKLEKKKMEQHQQEKERLRIRKKFEEDPVRAVRCLFDEAKASPTFDQATCEQYFQKTLGDSDRQRDYRLEDWMPPCPPPTYEYTWFDTRIGAVNAALKRMKNNSAPGGDGVSYRDYKLLRPALAPLISLLFSRIQKTCRVPDMWKYARLILLWKAGDTSLPSNFRPICLTNSLGKIFMSMLARSLAAWAKDNGVINTSWQKGFMPGVTGTIEHAYRVVGALQNAKSSGRQIVQVFIDLANAFGSVAHGHILFALARAGVPLPVQHLIQDYYRGLRVVVDSGSFLSSPIEQLIGVFQGCPLSPVIFNISIGILYDWYARPEFADFAYCFKVPDGAPPVSLLGTGFADDIDIVTKNRALAQQLLDGTDRFFSWSVTMAARPSKCRAIAMRKGATRVEVFDPMLTISRLPIPLIKPEEGFKILGKFFFPDLSLDRQKQKLLEKLESNLARLDASDLTSNQKLHALKFLLGQWINWELAVYQFPLTWVELKLDALVTRFIKRWLTFKQSGTTELFYLDERHHGLGLPCPSRLFKEQQVCSWHILKHSDDPNVSAFYQAEKVRIQQQSGKHFNGLRYLEELEAQAAKTIAAAAVNADAAAAVAEADKFRVAIAEFNVVHQIARSEANDEHVNASAVEPARPQSTSDDKRRQRQKLAKAIRDEEAAERVRHLASLLCQGSAVSSAILLTHDKEWLSRILQVPERTLRFGMRALTDHLATGANLFRWGVDAARQRCPHCMWLETTKHVLADCPATIRKRGWRHDNVLAAITKFVEARLTNSTQLRVDLKIHPCNYSVFPPEFGVPSGKRPDLLVFNRERRALVMLELTVPAEENFSKSHEYKLDRYAELVNEVRSALPNWQIRLVCIEVGCRGLHRDSLSTAVKSLADVNLLARPTTSDINDLAVRTSSLALKGSFLIWQTRRSAEWPDDVPFFPY